MIHSSIYFQFQRQWQKEGRASEKCLKNVPHFITVCGILPSLEPPDEPIALLYNSLFRKWRLDNTERVSWRRRLMIWVLSCGSVQTSCFTGSASHHSQIPKGSKRSKPMLSQCLGIWWDTPNDRLTYTIIHTDDQLYGFQFHSGFCMSSRYFEALSSWCISMGPPPSAVLVWKAAGPVLPPKFSASIASLVIVSHPHCKATSAVFAWCQTTAHESSTWDSFPCHPSHHFPVVGFCPEITCYHRMSLRLWWSLFFTFSFLELVCFIWHPLWLGIADNSII